MRPRTFSKIFPPLLCLPVWAGLLLGLGGNCLSAKDTPVEDTNSLPQMDWRMEATNHLGQWIWDTNAFDKQTVRLWKSFEVPSGRPVARATLRLTADNGYTLFLDGEEIGRGSDWRTVSEYDITQLLPPGRHVLGVEAFNDRLEGGLIFGMTMEQPGHDEMQLLSDDNWWIVPANGKNPRAWPAKVQPGWHHAIVVGSFQTPPWVDWPRGLAKVPPLQPVQMHFWQRGWFQLSLLGLCLSALLFSLRLTMQLTAQSKAQQVLHVERIRIARDIHDDLGAQLTQLLLLGEVAQRKQPANSAARGQFSQICDRARELAHAMDEVVWAVNARRDTVRDFSSYVCKYAQMFLNATSIRCRLDVEPELPALAFDLPVRRNLFLAVKEALNNAAKYSQAKELYVRIFLRERTLSVAVEDDGCGFDPEAAGAGRNGLANMRQRMQEIGGTFQVSSQPGDGCLVVFTVPVLPARRRWFRRSQPETISGFPEEPGRQNL